MEEDSECPIGTMKHKTKQEIENMLKSVGIENKSDKIIVYCFKGSRASNTLMALQNAGYKNVKNYFASWNEWSRNENFPVDDSKIL